MSLSTNFKHLSYELMSTEKNDDRKSNNSFFYMYELNYVATDASITTVLKKLVKTYSRIGYCVSTASIVKEPEFIISKKSINRDLN